MNKSLPQEYVGSPIENLVTDVREYAGELTIEVEPSAIPDVCKVLKDQFSFEYLSDLTATDHFDAEKRFEVSYNLVSIKNRKRIRLSCRVDEKEGTVPTVSHIWQSANWYEREAWDMVGVKFKGHPDHRRMYMPEDFNYFPLRKEFPLIGIPGSIQMPEKDPPKEYK